jgi:hypothetical protein
LGEGKSCPGGQAHAYGIASIAMFAVGLITKTFREITMTPGKIQQLKDEYEDAEPVWFLVNLQYRIIAYNKKAAENSLSFHKKQIRRGDSILDYARDTKNQVDAKFIQCFGQAATGKEIKNEQQVSYHSETITTKAVYTPVFEDQEVKAVSIVVHTINAT